jgi:hypothetical protein
MCCFCILSWRPNDPSQALLPKRRVSKYCFDEILHLRTINKQIGSNRKRGLEFWILGQHVQVQNVVKHQFELGMQDTVLSKSH